jgi:hypothetical protein
MALPGDGARNPKFMLTNWDSDIFWFQRLPIHKTKLQKLLQIADVYSAECERDVVLARNLSFTGQAMPVIPNAGGFSEADFAIPRLAPVNARQLHSRAITAGWVGQKYPSRQ